MNELKRRYVYEEDYEKVMTWAKQNNIRSPNWKTNFPFFLNKYLNR
jgi:hypothetical protein